MKLVDVLTGNNEHKDYVGVVDHTNKTVKFTCPRSAYIAQSKTLITVSDLASVVPSSGIVLNLTTPQKLTVTAQNGTKNEYFASVEYIKSDDAALVPSVELPDFFGYGKYVLHSVHPQFMDYFGTYLIGLTTNDFFHAVLPTWDVSNVKTHLVINKYATSDVDSGSFVNYNRDVVIKVTAENGNTISHKIRTIVLPFIEINQGYGSTKLMYTSANDPSVKTFEALYYAIGIVSQADLVDKQTGRAIPVIVGSYYLQNGYYRQSFSVVSSYIETNHVYELRIKLPNGNIFTTGCLYTYF